METCVRKLSETDFHLTETVQRMFTCHPAEGTAPDDLLDPAFWSNVAGKLNKMAEITAIPMDGTWYGKYLVTFISGSDVRVEPLLFLKIAKDEMEDKESIYTVKWISPPLAYGVIRKADKVRVKDGFDTKAAALAWASANERALKR